MGSHSGWKPGLELSCKHGLSSCRHVSSIPYFIVEKILYCTWSTKINYVNIFQVMKIFTVNQFRTIHCTKLN